MKKLIVITSLFLFACASTAQNKIPSSEAKNNVGKTLTACGKVESARYLSSSKGQPTFLNVGKPYPNQELTVVIWGNNRAKFGTPETAYNQKNICITGLIEDYKGKPQIEAKEKEQIQIKK